MEEAAIIRACALLGVQRKLAAVARRPIELARLAFAVEVKTVISSRTPEGSPNLCPVCGSRIKIEPSDPAGDAPCPTCGHLLWFTWENSGDAVVIKPTSAELRAGV